MLDFSDIGSRAFVIQYEDLISLIGLNTVSYILSQQKQNTSDEMILAYLNRENYDLCRFVKEQTGINFSIENMMQSKLACVPNLAYAFKMMDTAYRNGIKEFYVHSNLHSPIIENFIKQLEIPTNYVHGDIVPVLHNLPNCTYTTSDPTNIRKCLNVNAPFALTIVDDFQYVAPIVTDEKLIEELRTKNVYVQFTGVISAGVI